LVLKAPFKSFGLEGAFYLKTKFIIALKNERFEGCFPERDNFHLGKSFA